MERMLWVWVGIQGGTRGRRVEERRSFVCELSLKVAQENKPSLPTPPVHTTHDVFEDLREDTLMKVPFKG